METWILCSIAHRGPDDKGNYISKSQECALGFVRLSILDLSSFGSQPMSDHLKLYTQLFSMVRYIIIELKQYLENRYNEKNWRSPSDSSNTKRVK